MGNTVDTVEGLQMDFVDECPRMDENNFKQKISERLKRIINVAARSKRKNKKKNISNILETLLDEKAKSNEE